MTASKESTFGWALNGGQKTKGTVRGRISARVYALKKQN